MKSCNLLHIFLVIVGVMSFFFYPKETRAYYLFSDNFNSSLNNSWTVSPNEIGSAVIISNSYLQLTPLSVNKFPYLYKEIPDLDYLEVEFKFRFSGFPNFGAGIVLSDSLLTNGITREVGWNDFLFNVWALPNTGIQVSTVICPENVIGCVPNLYNNGIFSGISDTWYVFKLIKDNSKYSVYIDGNKIYESSSTEKSIKYVWFGNPENTGAVLWPTIDIDYLKILGSELSVPVIIIPGLGASWNVGAIMSGKDEGNWQIPGFVKNYEGLINSFKNAGYVDSGQNKNLYVFPYDWRRPLSVLATRLKDFIDTNIPEDERVNLVGHSMGGLVARTYAQIYKSDNRVNKLVMLGSPNEGAVKAYGAWEGALIFDDSWWSKVALELTTHFGVIAGESNIQTVQRIVPSLKDLLPTYEFLVFGNNAPLSISSANQNVYLNGLNSNFSSIDSITTALYSDDIETDSLIKVIPHTDGDLGTWIDGKPTDSPFITDDGDGTVIETSAKGPFTNVLQASGWHGDLVTSVSNVQKIFSVLEIDQTKAIGSIYDGNKDVFVAALRSPGILKVCNVELTLCNENLGLYFPNEKLFILPGYNNENLVVIVSDDGQRGKYALHLGKIDDEAKWIVVGGKLIKIGQFDSYNVNIAGENLVISNFPITKENCKIDGWKRLGFISFRNQGECVSYMEKSEIVGRKFFWWY